MPENEPTNDPAPEPATDPEPEPNEPDDLGEAGKKAIKAERDARKALEAKLKELEPLAAKAKELEDAKKSDLDRLNEDLAAEKKAREAAELRALRLEVAQDKGLTPAQAKWLQGSSKEEFEQAADELLETFAPAEPDPDPEGEPTPRRPVEDLRPGATPSAGEPVNIREVVDSIPRGI